jgi:acetyl-CoA carboxylase biotin carboxyl carrier protein
LKKGQNLIWSKSNFTPPLRPGLTKKNNNMDLKQIQDLVKMVNKSNISELTIEEKDIKITIKQKEDKYVTAAPIQQVQALPAAAPAPVAASAAPAAAAPAPVASNLITIKSPMIGTFYRRPSPDKPNLVDEGDEVRSGKVVCIIEAMKLFNEIESEISGKIVKVLVEDSTPVEFDQPLFLVEPA